MQGEYDEYVSVTEAGTKKVLSGFQSIMPPLTGKRIVEIGCGGGLLLEGYAKSNQVIGIDKNRKSLKLAKSRGISVEYHDLEKKLPFGDNRFDLVICKDVLMFITNASQLLDEMVRITKPGGMILLHVVNEFTLPDLIDYVSGKGLLKRRWYASSSDFDNPHVRFFTKSALIKRLADKNVLVKSDYSARWGFTIPLLKVKLPVLSLISSRLFSPGITLLCIKNVESPYK